MSDFISAADQLRQNIKTLSLDGNIGLNIVSIKVNTDMMGCRDITYRSNI